MHRHTPTAFGTQTRLGGWLGREETSCPGSIGASATAPWGLRAHVDGCHCASRIDNFSPLFNAGLDFAAEDRNDALKFEDWSSNARNLKCQSVDAIASNQRVPCLEALCRHGDEPLPGTRIARLERIGAATTGMVKRDRVRDTSTTINAPSGSSQILQELCFMQPCSIT